MRNLVQNARSALNRLRETLFKGLFRARFRYDVFISYSHSDAKDYAVNLRKQLGSLDFVCFIDEEESPPGLSLGPTLEKALRKSAVLVLLATERALTRPYVALEFERFVSTKRRIIPINISAALNKNDEQVLSKAPWNLINERKLIWIDETDEAFAKQNPSPGIADGIDKLFKYTRRNVRVRTEIIGTAALVLVAAFGAGFVIKGKNTELSEQVRQLEGAKKDTLEQQELAATARKETKAQQDIAEERTKEAVRQGELAEQAKKDATHQLGLARTATAEANKQQAIARVAKSEAEKQVEYGQRLRYVNGINLAQKELENLNAYKAEVGNGSGGRGRDLLNASLPNSASLHAKDVRGFEWYRLWRLFSEDESLLVSQDAPVNSVVFSPDGKTLAIGGEDGVVRLWDMNTGNELASSTAHSSSVKSLAFSPDGKKLIVGRKDGTLSLRDRTGNELKTLSPQPAAVNSMGFSPDGNLLAVSTDDKQVTLWNTNTWMVFKTLTAQAALANSAVFSSDSKTLATGNDDNTATLWDTSTWKKLKILSGHTAPVKSLAFSDDNKMLATGGADNTVRVWNTNDGSEVWTHKISDVEGTVTAVAFSPDGALAVCNHKWVFLFDVYRKQQLRWMYVGWANAVAFSPDGITLAAAGGAVGSGNPQTRGGDGSSAGSVTLLDRDWRKYEVSLADAGAPLTFSPNGKLLVAGDRTVKVLKTDTWQEGTSLGGGYTGAVAFSPNGRMLAAAIGRLDSNGYLIWSDWDIKLWDTNSWVSLMTRKAHSSIVRTIAFSPDSRILATGSEDGTVMLWNTADTKQEPVTLKDLISVASLAFFPDGRLAVGSRDGSLTIWNVETRRLLAKKSVGGIESMTLTTDGKRLANMNGQTVHLWNTETWEEVTMLEEGQYRLRSLALSPDGKTLATGNEAGTVTLWQADTGQELTVLPLAFHAYALAFSSDGKMLAAAAREQPKGTSSVKVWFAATEKEVAGQPIR